VAIDLNSIKNTVLCDVGRRKMVGENHFCFLKFSLCPSTSGSQCYISKRYFTRYFIGRHAKPSTKEMKYNHAKIATRTRFRSVKRERKLEILHNEIIDT
jgi:hypothetical protein